MTAIPRPEQGEFSPFYEGYVARLGGAEAFDALARQLPALRAGCDGLSDAQALHRYATGKWSVKEVIGHIADAERIFAYRALRIARGDRTPLPGWDENDYVRAAGFDARPLPELLADFEAARTATVTLLGGFGPEVWSRSGTANETPITVRALAYIIAGHAEHHLRILAERYDLRIPLPPLTLP